MKNLFSRQLLSFLIFVFTILSIIVPTEAQAGRNTSSIYVPTEFNVKYKHPVDELAETDVKLSFNKYGLITKINCIGKFDGVSKQKFTNTFKYSFHNNKSIKTVKAYLYGEKQPLPLLKMNKYGAVVSGKWGTENPILIAGKPTYYGNTHKLKNLKTTYSFPLDENNYDDHSVTYKFNKAGYLVGESDINYNGKVSYDKKGRRIGFSYKLVTGNQVDIESYKYKYQEKNDRVTTRKKYYCDSETEKLFSTITIKKWKKINANSNSLKSGRCMAAVLERFFEELDTDVEISSFVYELAIPVSKENSCKEHDFKTTKKIPATLKKNGSITKKCSKCGKIKKQTISYPKTVKLKKTTFTHTGKPIKPGVIVKDANGKTIPKKYYNIKYSNNKKIGNANVSIRFKGNYSGTKKLTFRIKKKSGSAKSYDGSYNNGRGFAVVKAISDSKMYVNVQWSSSASSGSEWKMTGTFDPDKAIFRYTDCIMTDYEYSDDGKRTETKVFSNGKGSFVFSKKNGVKFTWKDEMGYVKDNNVFTRSD